MITEIYIEGNKLDLFDDIGSTLNYQIDDIKDFSSRNTNYSKTITIPGNANNNKIFGHIYDLNIANGYFNSDPNVPNVGYNFDPGKQANSQIYVNKIQVFKGVIRLLEIRINNGIIEYDCAVFGELGGFVNDIGKLLNNKTLLEDLDTFNKYNQNWTYSNIVNSWSASGVSQGKGVVYPLVDFGLCKASGNATHYHLNAFRPAFFVKEIIDAIIEKSGYTYESNFLNSDFFKTLIIPNNRANLEQIRKDLLSALATNAKTQSGDLDFNPLTLNLFTSNANTSFTFTGTNGTIGTLSFGGTFRHSKIGTTIVKLYRNAEIIREATYTNGFDGQQFNIDFSSKITLNANDNIAVNVQISSLDQDFSFDPLNLELDFVADYAQPSNASAGVLLNMQNLLPKGIEQKDFFLSICRMFNLYVYEDIIKTKHLKIEPFIDFYGTNGFVEVDQDRNLLLHGQAGDASGLVAYSDQKQTTIDWTDKIDYSKLMSIKPMSELNARFYDFKYQEDEDFYNDAYQKRYNQTYGDRVEDTKYQFSKERIETQVIFAPTFLAQRSGDEKLASQIYKVENNQEVSFDSKIRILQFKKIDNVSSYSIRGVYPDGTTNYGSQTSYGFAGHLDDPTSPTKDLNFGVPKELRFTLTNPYPTANLFTAFWASYLAEIISKDSKLLTCYLYLNPYDIYSLDFSKLIYLNGSLFRLNKIVDYDPTKQESTKVELLKVVELNYN